VEEKGEATGRGNTTKRDPQIKTKPENEKSLPPETHSPSKIITTKINGQKIGKEQSQKRQRKTEK